MEVVCSHRLEMVCVIKVIDCKTIFTRMTALKAGELDDGGMGINAVDKALKEVGITVRDGANSFRDLDDVLSDVSKGWGTYNEFQKAQITGALAGTRQANILISLLDNEEMSRKLVTEQIGKEGLALERYGEYLGGVEAAQNRMNAAWEKLAQGAISSVAVSGFYDLAAGALDFIGALGGIPAVLGVIITSLIAFNGVSALSAAGIFTLADAWAGLSLAMSANPIGIIVLALGAAVLAFNLFYETASEKLEKLNNEIKKHNDELSRLRNNANSINELSANYNKLKKEYEDTGIASQEFFDVQNQLKELVPSLSGEFDEYGNFLLDDTNKMDDLTKATLEQIEAEKKLRQAKIDESSDVSAKFLLNAQSKKEQYDRGVVGFGSSKRRVSETEQLEANVDWMKTLEEVKSSFAQMDEDAKKSFIKSLSDGGSEGAKLAAEVFAPMFRQSIVDQWSGKDDIIPSEIAEKAGSDMGVSAYKGFSDTMKSLTSAGMDDLTKKSMEGTLSFSDIESLSPEYLSALSMEGDKLQLNIDKVKELQLAKAEEAVESAKISMAKGEATQQEVTVLQLYYDQLLAQSQNTFGQFNQTAWQYDQLLWQISNDATAAGYSFTDMEGKALSSSQSIFDYLSSSPAAFANFTQQIANQTGRTVEEVTNIINQMIGNTISNLNAMQAASAGRYTAMAAQAGYTPTQKTTAPLFPTISPSYSGGGGSSGGSSSTQTKEQKAAEKLKATEEAINEARKNGVDALKDQLKAYKDIIDIRKDLLDSLAKEREYSQDLEDKKNVISDIQNQIVDLQLDDSEEAKARTLELQDELAVAQGDLENLQYDRSIEMQKSALDQEYAALEAKINSAISQIESIDASSLRNFTQQLSSILASMEIHHDGAKSGFVGGVKSNEQFAKLMKGELVVNEGQMNNFMGKILPSMMSNPSVSSVGGGGISLEMPINVAGSLDKQVIPDLERIANTVVKKINDAMLSRGFNRRADMFAN